MRLLVIMKVLLGTTLFLQAVACSRATSLEADELQTKSHVAGIESSHLRGIRHSAPLPRSLRVMGTGGGPIEKIKSSKTRKGEAMGMGGGPSRKSKSSKSSKGAKNENNLFTPAEDIEFFRSGIDSEIFEWVNKSEVSAGETTCGFLKPSLGWLPEDTGVVFPKIKVYICMKFAAIQPAPRG